MSRQTCARRAERGPTAGERSDVPSLPCKGAVTWSRVSASFSDSSQSFLTTLPLLIPSIQPHHYGNCLDVSPSAPNLCHPAASDTRAVKSCLIAARLHEGSRFVRFRNPPKRTITIFSLYWEKKMEEKPGECWGLGCEEPIFMSLLPFSCFRLSCG